MSVVGPGCVKMALCWHRAQNAAGIRIAERKCSWNPFSERPWGVCWRMRKSLAQAAKASSSPATPMIAITRFML